MAGFPGAAGSLVPAHNILSTDMASHVQLPIKKTGNANEGEPIGVQLLYSKLLAAPLNDWQSFC